jgi:hypothetical protein
MKTRFITTGFVMAIVMAAFTLNSCKKEVTNPKSSNQNNDNNLAGKDNLTDPVAISSIVSDEFHNAIFNSETNSSNLEKSGNASCVTITMDTINKPYNKTLDYGTGCTGSDGKVRKGQLIITFDNTNVRLTNNSIVCSFNNFSVDNQQMTGTFSFHNNGRNTQGHITFNENINVQTTTNGVTDSINGAALYEWIGGQNSNTLADLQFKITGSATASDHKGRQVTSTITNALIRNYDTPGCNFYIEGKVLVRQSGQPDETFDYGNGTCTGLVKILCNGQTTVKHQ